MKDAKYNKSLKGRYRQLKAAAKNGGHAFNISYYDYALLQANSCYYCDSELPNTGSGVDRITSKGGYTVKNVRPCCTVCNKMKNDLSETQFYKHLLKIKTNLKLK